MAMIVRECAHVTASERGGYELNICPEKGISAQRYKCAECNTDLVLSKCHSDDEDCKDSHFSKYIF